MKVVNGKKDVVLVMTKAELHTLWAGLILIENDVERLNEVRLGYSRQNARVSKDEAQTLAYEMIQSLKAEVPE